MKFTVLTLGCKTNQAESNKIERALCEAGHEIIHISDKPDICIINTCSVTSKADQQSRQLINKNLKNNMRVIVTGCYSELNYEKLKRLKPEIDIIRNKDKTDILNTLKIEGTGSKEPYYHNRHRPIVKIQDGCNNACSYCVIPMTRGGSRSLSPDEITSEISHYESLNYKEVVLTGIHLGAYGADLMPRLSLARLLKLILNKTNDMRIRLSSIEVKEIDDELLEVLSERRICKHLHIPLQSGDDKILRSMNRTYKAEDYRKKINNILYLFNEIALGADVMVGFPGEKEPEFNNTKQLLKEIPFTYLHVFTFSPRPGTKADKLPQQVDEETKRLRSLSLRVIGDAKKREFILKNIGKVKHVIVESKTCEGFTGTSDDYIKVFLSENSRLAEGMSVNIKLDSYINDLATGLPLI